MTHHTSNKERAKGQPKRSKGHSRKARHVMRDWLRACALGTAELIDYPQTAE